MAPGGDGCIFKYNFNRPDNTFDNQSDGTASNFSAQLESNAPNGYPSKNKGIYFTTTVNTPGCIYVEDVVLNHTFTFHMWVRVEHTDIKMPIFEKNGAVSVGITDFGGFFGQLGTAKATDEGGLFEVVKWEYITLNVC